MRGIHRSHVNPLSQRPVTQSFDVFFDLRLNKRLTIETPVMWDTIALIMTSLQWLTSILTLIGRVPCALIIIQNLNGTYKWNPALKCSMTSGPLLQLISPWSKWPPFRRRYFQVHFCEWTRQIWGIWKLRPAYSPETPNLGQNRWCFVPCDLEIWWMTLENNRAPLICCFKLCATFHSHWWIQTGVAVRKRPIWVKFYDF